MGITIVQKSDPSVKKLKAKKALILGGGAITGASFKIGGLKALNDYLVNFNLSDFDLYLGISSGSLLAAPLMGGVTPEEMFKSFEGSSKHFTKLQPHHFYWPNWSELLVRPVEYAWKAISWLPGVGLRLVTKLPEHWQGFSKVFIAFLKEPSLRRYEELFQILDELILKDHDFPSLLELLPSGIFDNTYLEKYMRENIKRNNLTNDFRVAHRLRKKKLYISAMSLDGANEVIFGPDEVNHIPISKAVQASTAMPGFYRPVKIDGAYYVDGIVPKTANLELMASKGAKLIICYNPFRPYENKSFLEYLRRRQGPKEYSLTKDGLVIVINQIFRTFFHARLHSQLEAIKANPKFKGDIILIEPRSDDVRFFSMNPLFMGHQIHAAQLGFESVRDSIEEKYTQMRKILASYGIKMNRKNVEAEYKAMHGEEDPFKTKKVLQRKKG